MLQSLQSALSTFFGYLPQVVGALVVLLIGYLVARLLRAGVTRLLRRLRLDERLSHGSGGEYVSRFAPDGSPAKLVGLVVQWVLLVFVIVSAVSVLDIPAVTGFMNQVLAYLPHVIAALVIFLVAAAVAATVSGIVHRTMGETPTGRVVRSAAPALVMAIAVFMMLNQLGIAPVIVTATYVALIGSVALGAALAFGLGGRDAAADLINSGYRKAQQRADHVDTGHVDTGHVAGGHVDTGHVDTAHVSTDDAATRTTAERGRPPAGTTDLPSETPATHSSRPRMS